MYKKPKFNSFENHCVPFANWISSLFTEETATLNFVSHSFDYFNNHTGVLVYV